MLAAYRQTQAIAEAVTAADANDQRGKDVLLGAYVGLEETFFRSGQYARALDFGHRALKVGNELAADASNAASRVQLAQAQSLLGDGYESRSRNASGQSRIAAADLAQAQSSYQKAFDEYSALRKVGALPYLQNSDFDRLPGRIALSRSARINASPSQPSLSKQ